MSRGFFGNQFLGLGLQGGFFGSSNVPVVPQPQFVIVGGHGTNPNTSTGPVAAWRDNSAAGVWHVIDTSTFGSQALLAAAREAKSQVWILCSNSAGGADSLFHRSTNALTSFTTIASGFSALGGTYLDTIAAHESTLNWVASGASPADCLHSTDNGLTWTGTSQHLGGSGIAKRVVWAPPFGHFAIGGTSTSNVASFSIDDGVTFAAAAAPPPGGAINDLTSDPNFDLVLASINSGPTQAIYQSADDGQTYTLASDVSGIGFAPNRLATDGNGLIYIATRATNGDILVADSPTTFAAGTVVTVSAVPITDICAGFDANDNTLFLAVDQNGEAFTSPDGITWTLEATGLGPCNLFGCAYGRVIA